VVFADGMPGPAVLVLVDVTGRVEAASDLLARIADALVDEGATRSRETIGGTPVDVFRLPRQDADQGYRPTHLAYFVRDDALCASDSLEVARGVLARWGGAANDALAKLPSYAAVMDRCAADAAAAAPHARWFVDPFGLIDAGQAALPPRDADDDEADEAEGEESIDYLEIARNQGFTGIRGAGGYVHFGVGPCDVYNRAYIHAPQPHELAMRMLKFPNDAPAPPEGWVPADVATYLAFNWDMLNAFDMSETLVNELFGFDEAFDDIVESLRDDPQGPQVDLRQELMANLGSRFIVLFDHALPITPASEQRLFAAETVDPAAVAEAIRKQMVIDQAVIERQIGPYVVWEVPAEEDDLEVDVQAPPGRASARADDDEQERILARSFVTVAHGYVLIASGRDLLMKVLRDEDQRDAMAEDVDFRLVGQQIDREMQARGWTDASFRWFSRTDAEFQPTYELLQAGKLPSAESLVVELLRAALGGEEGLDEFPLDASSLPPYEAARRYFGPAGWLARTEEDGWFIVHFTLRTQAPVARAP
jgi:hypothetical protein